MPEIHPNLFLRFKGNIPGDDSQVDLAKLGESLVGFDSVFKDFAHLLRIRGELEIKAAAPGRGSLVIEITALLNDVSVILPFGSVGDFLDFLRVAGSALYEQARDYFNAFEGVHRTLNDWASKYPIDFALFSALFAKAVLVLMEKARKQKDKIDYSDPELPKRIAEELHKLIARRGFKKALKPLADDEVDSIEVSDEKSFRSAVKIDQESLANYMAEDEQILPHLENGIEYTLRGTITSLKSTRGDSLTFQLMHNGETYNLDTLPAEGNTSKTYKNFYQEHVEVTAEVIRKSQYQKPKLKIKTIDLVQGELDFATINEENGLSSGEKK